MKMQLVPQITCTEADYKNTIEPMLDTLDELDFCPKSNKQYNHSSFDCEAFETCDCCPFGQANRKIREAIASIEEIKIEYKT